jgi:hypothetical protein
MVAAGRDGKGTLPFSNEVDLGLGHAAKDVVNDPVVRDLRAHLIGTLDKTLATRYATPDDRFAGEDEALEATERVADEKKADVLRRFDAIVSERQGLSPPDPARGNEIRRNTLGVLSNDLASQLDAEEMLAQVHEASDFEIAGAIHNAPRHAVKIGDRLRLEPLVREEIAYKYLARRYPEKAARLEALESTRESLLWCIGSVRSMTRDEINRRR